MKKKRVICVSIALLLVLLLAVLLMFRSCNKNDDPSSLPVDSGAVDWNGNQHLPNGSSSAGKICVPGFDSLVFVANQTVQKVNFYNPEVNGDRLFQMTLFIEDKEYWKSGYCPSGSGYYEIKLSAPIESGEYAGYLKIECFNPDGTQLNGARVTFNLIVTEETTE